MPNALKTARRNDEPAAEVADGGPAEGSIVTRFVRMGEAEERLDVSPGTTLADLLARRGLDLDSGEVYYNLNLTSTSELGTLVEPDSLVMYTRKIRGGSGTADPGR